MYEKHFFHILGSMFSPRVRVSNSHLLAFVPPWLHLAWFYCSFESEWAARRAHRVYQKVYHPRGEGLVWSGFFKPCFRTLFHPFSLFSCRLMAFICCFAFFLFLPIAFIYSFHLYSLLTGAYHGQLLFTNRLLGGFWAAFGRLLGGFWATDRMSPLQIEKPFNSHLPRQAQASRSVRVYYRIFIDWVSLWYLLFFNRTA